MSLKRPAEGDPGPRRRTEMEKNQIIELKIEDMLDDGRAFGRCEGCAVFVSGGAAGSAVPVAGGRTACRGAVPGDTVKAKITKTKKSSVEAVLTEVTEPSPDRVEAECPYFGSCGGCTLQELSYDAQLRLKENQVRTKLARLGGIDDPKVCGIIGADAVRYYRSKAVFAVGPHGEVGFLKSKSHFVMDIGDCMLQSDAAMVCADALRHFLKSEPGLAGKVIKQLTVRTAFGTGEVMAVIESEKKEFPRMDELIQMLDDAVYSLALDCSEEPDEEAEPFFSLESVALIHKGRCHVLAGRPTITEELTGSRGISVRFEISPQSFFQVNPEQMVRLYEKTAEYAALKGGETVLDLYCGAGTIGIWLLNELRSRDEEAFGKTKVIGIESVKPAVIGANRNSVINGLVNTRYFCGKAEEELPGMMGLSKLYKWNEVNERVERDPEIRIEKADVVILDPPRAGCEEALLKAVLKAEPDRIVYVSCDPGTLARDIKFLCANGCKFIEATPVDQFPLTSHIEAVARIQRKK